MIGRTFSQALALCGLLTMLAAACVGGEGTIGDLTPETEAEPPSTLSTISLDTCSATNPGLAQDCTTLLGFKDALAGDVSLNWQEDIPISQWDGITVEGSPPRVTGLHLSDKGITGSIPTGLDRLTNLTNLTLERNQLTGPIPTELGNLTNLERLYLGYNGLTGPIPTELGNLTNLRWLFLGDSQLTGNIPAELGNLTNLIGLYPGPQSTDQATSPAELGSLANLDAVWTSAKTN